jgi:hypothetical protein
MIAAEVANAVAIEQLREEVAQTQRAVVQLQQEIAYLRWQQQVGLDIETRESRQRAVIAEALDGAAVGKPEILGSGVSVGEPCRPVHELEHAS